MDDGICLAGLADPHAGEEAKGTARSRALRRRRLMAERSTADAWCSPFLQIGFEAPRTMRPSAASARRANEPDPNAASTLKAAPSGKSADARSSQGSQAEDETPSTDRERAARRPHPASALRVIQRACVRITSTRRAAHTATLSPGGMPPRWANTSARRLAKRPPPVCSGQSPPQTGAPARDAHARGAPEQREQPLLCGGIQKKSHGNGISARPSQGPVARTRCPASRIAPRGTIATKSQPPPPQAPAQRRPAPSPLGEGWGGGEDRGGGEDDEGSPQISKRSKRMNALREIPIWKGFPLAEPIPHGLFLFRQMSRTKSQSQTAILVAKLNPFPRYTREWCHRCISGR